MTATIPITILVAGFCDPEPRELDNWLAANCPTGALVLQEPGQSAPTRAAKVCSVPLTNWIALPTCLCCLASNDPRLILLRAKDDHDRKSDALIRHIVILLRQQAHAVPVLRALSTLVPLGFSCPKVRFDEHV